MLRRSDHRTGGIRGRHPRAKGRAGSGPHRLRRRLKGADSFPEAIPKSKLEPAFTNTDVDHGRFEIPQEDTVLEIPVPGELAVIDRWEYGRRIIDGAEDVGVNFRYDTVVKNVVQNDDGRVTGVEAIRKGDPITYEADIVIDAAGSLSVLQDNVDFSESTFDTNVDYSHFCSAYREIVEVEEPVEWDDALVFKPTERAAGYLWYFPRTETEINAGLGFQMTEEPMQLVDDLKRDLETRPEFDGAEVEDKLGAALPTRRPYDSAVHPGTWPSATPPATSTPPPAAASPGPPTAASTPPSGPSRPSRRTTTARTSSGSTTRRSWTLRRALRRPGRLQHPFDGLDVDDLMGLLAAMPGDKLAEALYSGSTDIGLKLKLESLVKSRGHWGTIWNLYKTKRRADELLAHYENYPTSPEGLAGWQDRRDELMETVYETTGADPKY